MKVKICDFGILLICNQAGLDYYANGEWEKALQLNKHFDPAILCIESAQEQIKMFKKISESLNFE